VLQESKPYRRIVAAPLGSHMHQLSDCIDASEGCGHECKKDEEAPSSTEAICPNEYVMQGGRFGRRLSVSDRAERAWGFEYSFAGWYIELFKTLNLVW